MDVSQQVVQAVQGIHPYQPGKPISELQRELGLTHVVKLASNENPLGPSPKALEKLISGMSDLARYPDGSGFALKQSLSSILSCDVSQITLGNGSNDVLVLLAEAFLTLGDHAVYSQYAFAVYHLAVQASGARASVVPALSADHPTSPLGHDLPAMLAAIEENTKILFIANPNNPTGSFIPRSELQDFLTKVPEQVVVVIDEAYFEYLADDLSYSAIDWLSRFPNLVITRTFSKIYGLAGLRVGYSVSSADIADYLNRIRQPFNVNSLALLAAEAALFDSEYVSQSKQMKIDGMKYLDDQLQNFPLTILPSQGNFILIDLNKDASQWNQSLLQKGVIVRPVGNYGLPQHLRVSIGTIEELSYFCEILTQIVDTV